MPNRRHAYPPTTPTRLSMRIAPRTMLCATDFPPEQSRKAGAASTELRELCSAAGDKVSLAIAMTGLVTELCLRRAHAGGVAAGIRTDGAARVDRRSHLDHGVGLRSVRQLVDAGEFGEILRLSQTVIDLAAGDPAKGACFVSDQPLAIALAWRGVARWWLGRPGWRQDHHDAASRWPETAIRQPSPVSSPGPTV